MRDVNVEVDVEVQRWRRPTRKVMSIKITSVTSRIMDKKEIMDICNNVVSISPYIRFVGVIDDHGRLMGYRRREDLAPLLDEKDTKYQFSHIAIKTDLESFFDENLGEIEFVWEERKKVQIISFAINKSRVWMSIDKMVIRTEMLRIIDACLPIVRAFS